MSPSFSQEELEELLSRRKLLAIRLFFNLFAVVGAVAIVSPVLTGAYDSVGEWAKLIFGSGIAIWRFLDAIKPSNVMKPIDVSQIINE